MIEKYEKWCSVAFTGHRFISSDRVEEVRESVSNEIRLLYFKGFRNFFCGMALGFDMLAAEGGTSRHPSCCHCSISGAKWKMGCQSEKTLSEDFGESGWCYCVEWALLQWLFSQTQWFHVEPRCGFACILWWKAKGRNFLYCKKCKAVELANLQPVLMVVFWIGIAKKVMTILYI